MRVKSLLIVAGALLLSTACSDDPSGNAAVERNTAVERSTSVEPVETTDPVPQLGNPDRYCRITQRLGAAGEKAFGGLGRDASPADYEAAERAFVLNNAALLDALISAAPATLTPHVDTMLNSMRERGGLPVAHVPNDDAANAEKHVHAFERKHC